MLTLNLISSGQKKEIKLRHIYSFIKTVNLTLIIIIIAIAIVLLVARVILQSKFNEIVSQTTLVTKSNQGYNNNVREINNKLNFIVKIQNEFIPWSNLIKDLAEMTPPDINFYYIKLDSAAQTIKIKGKAKLRSSLLDFKGKMENADYFRDIEFPIKNILEKENIDFEINAKLNLSSL
ncbi:MAG: hypothetical protein Q7K35_03130 [bacterium]|nr:hypothetical protein [bacterium]